MKKLFVSMLCAAAAFVACKKNQPIPTYDLNVQLTLDGKPCAIAGINVSASDGTTSLSAVSDASGVVKFSVVAGNYALTAAATITEDGYRNSYNGTASAAVTDKAVDITLPLVKSTSSQIIIKELYAGGCQKDDASGGYSDDAYITLYNNSETEVDASNVVISLINPSMPTSTKNYLVDGVLKFEKEGWIPAYSAIWWFTTPVKIPAYSEITIAIFGAIDHTKTYKNSVNLDNSAYYWMSNKEISDKFKAAKYQVSESIPANHYLSTIPVANGTAWVMSNSAPGVFIAKMTPAEAKAKSEDTANFDTTCGTAVTAVKFPADAVLDAIEVFDANNIEKSKLRFPAKINSGYVALTNKQGHTLYRNVDKEATLAIEGNADKIVLGYTEDPSGIDAEKSIANGAKIVYKDSNNSGNDFHERTIAAKKK